ncbi:hypothetical protein COLO4_33561 [Corchorus olitorius]|uniref:Peptidase C1A papain C-terminal domain-containing protein n=1 Tax=Corchorus olitorius TaxID=93759 RepID=A0A1R3GSQ7_9ROSI|nr:hypothetical protein COLO4_33561 [Corchorus olitorius]
MAQYGRVYKDLNEKAKHFRIFKENVAFIDSFNATNNKPYKLAIEGITKLKTGNLISLSEQELVDCDVDGEDEGCEGGLMDDAFDFIQNNKGLTSEANYPYTGQDGTCNTNKESNHAATINGHEDVPANSEATLLKAVANQHVSVAIDASGSEFQSYSGGILPANSEATLLKAVANQHVSAAIDASGSEFQSYWAVYL